MSIRDHRTGVEVPDLAAIFEQREAERQLAEATLAIMMNLGITPDEVSDPDAQYDFTLRIGRNDEGSLRVLQYSLNTVVQS